MERELDLSGKALSNPERPFVAILGGAKVSDKIEVVENLMKIADAMLIGGGMAYTFLKAQGLPIGKSLVEDGQARSGAQLLAEAKQRNFGCCCPRPRARRGIQSRHATRPRSMHRNARRLDGPRHRPGDGRRFRRGNRARQDHRVEWADGRFRDAGICPRHAGNGQAVAAATARGATSIVGGGDSVAAVHQAGVADKISHISTGGGASLEFLAGDKAARRRSAHR